MKKNEPSRRIGRHRVLGLLAVEHTPDVAHDPGHLVLGVAGRAGDVRREARVRQAPERA